MLKNAHLFYQNRKITQKTTTNKHWPPIFFQTKKKQQKVLLLRVHPGRMTSWVVSKISSFHLGEMIQFDKHIFWTGLKSPTSFMLLLFCWLTVGSLFFFKKQAGGAQRSAMQTQVGGAFGGDPKRANWRANEKLVGGGSHQPDMVIQLFICNGNFQRLGKPTRMRGWDWINVFFCDIFWETLQVARSVSKVDCFVSHLAFKVHPFTSCFTENLTTVYTSGIGILASKPHALEKIYRHIYIYITYQHLPVGVKIRP